MKRSEPDRVRCPTRRLRSPFPLAKNQNFDQKKGLCTSKENTQALLRSQAIISSAKGR